MVVVVLTPQVMDIPCADQRTTELAGDLDYPFVGLLLLSKPILLDLEVDVVGSECLHELVGMAPRVGGTALEQELAEAGLKTAGERDHSVRVASDLFHVD